MPVVLGDMVGVLPQRRTAMRKGQIFVKTDQEPSIQAVPKDMRKLRNDETIIEASKK